MNMSKTVKLARHNRQFLFIFILLYMYFVSHQVQHNNTVITVKHRLKHKTTMKIHKKNKDTQ